MTEPKAHELFHASLSLSAVYYPKRGWTVTVQDNKGVRTSGNSPTRDGAMVLALINYAVAGEVRWKVVPDEWNDV